MKDKIVRAKNAVQKHRTKIVFGSGVLVGAGGILYWGGRIGKNATPMELFLEADNRMLQSLIDNPDGAMTWTHKPTGAVVNVFNEANSTLPK